MNNDASNAVEPSIPIVAFTSGKGGCGKTTLAVNFADVVSQAGVAVLLADFDLANRGCTGLFSGDVKSASECLTVTRLLRDDNLQSRELFQPKPGIFVLPASSVREQAWVPEHDLDTLVALLRTRLLAVAKRQRASLIVLDCFCGIDLLTTAASGIANDTLIVNEPDIVTFSGSLTLVSHLLRSFKGSSKKLRLHFIINRVRSNFTVPDLVKLYRNNLERAAHEIVLCHFPYHPRVFDTFGKYPFVSDLLPRSLFTQKFKLLTYLLFKGSAEHLILPDVLTWSKEKIRSVYLRSIDPTAIDPEFLITKFTNFPLWMGMWLLLAFLTLRTITLTPSSIWSAVLVLATALSSIVASSLLHGFWLAARLNFSLAFFRYQLGKMHRALLTRTHYFIGTVFPVFSGVLMLISALTLSILLLSGTFVFLDWMFDLGVLTRKTTVLWNRQVEIAIALPVRSVDLSGDDVYKVDFNSYRSVRFEFLDSIARSSFLGGSFTPSKSNPETNGGRLFNKLLRELCHTTIEIRNTRFNRCIFSPQFFDKSRLRSCKYLDCSYVSTEPQQSPKALEQINGKTLDQADEEGVEFQISYPIWQDVKIYNLNLPQPILFSHCQFNGVHLSMVKRNKILEDDADFVGFENCDAFATVDLEPSSNDMPIYTAFSYPTLPPARALLIAGQRQAGLVPHRLVRCLPQDEYGTRRRASGLGQRIQRLDAAARKNPAEIGDITNLIESCVLAGEPQFWHEAESWDITLLERALKEEDPRAEGWAKLLRLIMCIVKPPEPQEAGVRAKLDDWCAWLDKNGGSKAVWKWDTWATYSLRRYPPGTLNPVQVAMLGAVNQATQRELDAKSLKAQFDKILHPPAGSASTAALGATVKEAKGGIPKY